MAVDAVLCTLHEGVRHRIACSAAVNIPSFVFSIPHLHRLWKYLCVKNVLKYFNAVEATILSSTLKCIAHTIACEARSQLELITLSLLVCGSQLDSCLFVTRSNNFPKHTAAQTILSTIRRHLSMDTNSSLQQVTLPPPHATLTQFAYDEKGSSM